MWMVCLHKNYIVVLVILVFRNVIIELETEMMFQVLQIIIVWTYTPVFHNILSEFDVWDIWSTKTYYNVII